MLIFCSNQHYPLNALSALITLDSKFKLIKELLYLQEHNFDFEFAKLCRTEKIEDSIQFLNEFRNLNLDDKIKRDDCDTLIITLDILRHFKLLLRLFLERKLLRDADNFIKYLGKIKSLFDLLSLGHNMNTDFKLFNSDIEILERLDAEASPVFLSIIINYTIWYMVREYKIDTKEKLLSFLETIDNTIICYARSNYAFFEVIQFLASNYFKKNE